MSNVSQGEAASSNTGSSSLTSGDGDASNGEDGENFIDHGKRFQYDGHGKSYDNDNKSGESKGTLRRENGGWSGTIGGSGTGGNPGSGGYGLPTSFYISNTDPQVHYTGLWVLKRATDLSITHSTVVQGSTASLRFKGKFYQCFLGDPDTQL